MSGGGSARKEINMDNKAYQKMDYALCLLSAAADGKRHGCIVNSFHQVTSSFPPILCTFWDFRVILRL